MLNASGQSALGRADLNTKQLMLCVLMGGPASGYDIKKTVELKVSRVSNVSITNIYPVLNELAREKLVSFRKVEQEGRPTKKVYELTLEGRDACLKMFEEMQKHHSSGSEFLFILIFASFLPRSLLADLIQHRLEDIEAQLRGLNLDAQSSVDLEEAKNGVTGQRFTLGLGRELLETERSYLRRNSSWLLAKAPAKDWADLCAAD